MAKINAINNKSEELTVDPGASGDSFVQFDINTTGEFRIGVDDTDDSFRISQGSALGTNDCFEMSAAGECTMNLQPAFSAYNSADDDDVTGDFTEYVIICNTEIFDQNDDYATGTGIFTAPVAGKYVFSMAIEYHDIGASHDQSYGFVRTSNASYMIIYRGASAFDVGGTISFSNCCIADMDAADTAYMSLLVGLSTKTIDINGGGNVVTRFGGYLAC